MFFDSGITLAAADIPALADQLLTGQTPGGRMMNIVTQLMQQMQSCFM
jgi:hypothetical protein